MDQQLLLAQFNALRDPKFEQQSLQLSKQLDINYVVPEDPITNYSGYTALHIAVLNTNIPVVNDLIDRGANLFKQEPRFKCTPLHTALEINYHPLYQNVLNLSGKVEIPVANVLLSGQVKSGNSSNPKNTNGLSHLHIASIFNHAECVNLLKNSVNETVYITDDQYCLPGASALHFAFKFSSVEASEILLKNGANIHLKDHSGISPIHLLLNRLKETSDFIIMGRPTCVALHERELGRIQEMITLILKTREKNHINFVDDTGLSAFHLACCLTDPTIAREYLNRNVDMHMQVHNESMFWPGWTPFHFAACFSLECVKYLILYGVDLNIKNASRISGLEMLMARYPPSVMYLILSERDEFLDLMFDDQRTSLLFAIRAMDDCDELVNLLKIMGSVNSSVPADSPLFPGYTILHLAVSFNEKIYLEGKPTYIKAPSEENYLTRVNSNDSDILVYWKRIKVCISGGCNVTKINAEGLTPVHLSFKLHKIECTEKIMEYCHHNVVDPTGLSHLHIACAVGNMDFVVRFLTRQNVNSTAKINFEWFEAVYNTYNAAMYERAASGKFRRNLVPVRANSTPLHLAVTFDFTDIVQHLLNNGADVYAKDSMDFTPIHLSMASPTNAKIAQLLLNRTPNIRDSITQRGLSHLHVAAYADNAEAVNKLIAQGTNVNIAFDMLPKKNRSRMTPEFNLDESTYLANFTKRTPLHIAVSEDCAKAATALINNNADIHIGHLSSPLQNLKEHIRSDVVKSFVPRFKRDNLEVGAIDYSGITALHFACARIDFEWSKRLLEKGANVNARIDYGNEYVPWHGDTPLNIFIFGASVPEGRRLPGAVKLLKLLLNYGADVTIRSLRHQTALHMAYTSFYENAKAYGADSEEMVFMLIAGDMMLNSQRSYAVNPMDEQGLTHFHYACVRNKVEHIRKFLDNGVDVNIRTDSLWRNFSGYGPLHFACSNRAWEAINLLIQRGGNIKGVNTLGNLPLHSLLSIGFVNEQIVDLMLNRGVDINTKNILGRTPLDSLMRHKYFTLKQLKYLFSKGASIDFQSSEDIIGLLLKNSEVRSRQTIIDEFFKGCKLKRAIENGFKPIHSAVLAPNDDPIQLTVSDYINMITRILRLDCDIDMQDVNGSTALHVATKTNNLYAIDALLDLGADVNVTNKKGEPPFVKTVIEGARNRLFSNSVEARSLARLEDHVYKLALIKEYSSRYNRQSAIIFSLFFEEAPARRQPCIDEFIKIKNDVTNSRTIIETIDDYWLLSIVERKKVDDYFRRAADLRQKLPKFCGILRMKYLKIVVKRKLRILTMHSFNKTTKIYLPYICVNAVLDYLSNYDMICFLKIKRSCQFKFLL